MLLLLHAFECLSDALCVCVCVYVCGYVVALSLRRSAVVGERCALARVRRRRGGAGVGTQAGAYECWCFLCHFVTIITM